MFESCFWEKVVDACRFFKKETLTQVVSHEFCDIYKNILFYRTPHVTASGRGGRGFPCLFFKIKKGALILEKKGPHFVHLWVKFSTQGVILRLFSRKNSQIFLWEVFSLVYFSKTFIKAPWFHKPSPTHKNFLLCSRAWYVLNLF